MSIFGVTGVRLNHRGRVESVVICRIDGASNAWIGEAYELAAHDIASLLYKGEEVHGIFVADGLSVLGPKFRYVVYEGGQEGIELAEDLPGKRLQDLVLLV